MQRAFTGRRLLACLAGSLLLHSAVVVVCSRSRAPAQASASAEPALSFEPQEPDLAAVTTRVALVGEQPSGRGRALAGSNPHRRGAPRFAPRLQRPIGRADGPGTAGATLIGSAVGSAPTGDDAPFATTPAVDSSDVPIPPPSAARVTSDDAKDPPPRPTVDAASAFDELARAQMMRLAKGNGGGVAGFGSGNSGTGFGLTTDLSGRHRRDSPVVAAPVIIQRRSVECELPGTLHVQAVVRVLVTRDGSAVVPRLLQPSGYASFDRCALSYVLALRFSPGTDAGGKPLDVWMNVRLAPSTLGQLEDAR